MPARDRRPPGDYQTDPGVPFAQSALRADAPVGAVAAHTVARTIDQMMAQRGFTLRALAAATGMDHSTISRTLRGLTYPDVDTLAQIQTVLDVHLWPPPEGGGTDGC